MSDRVVSEHYVENTWTCTNCRVVNRGRDMRCESCSSPRDKSETEETATSSVVSDPKLLAQAKAGPNRICPFCDSQNRAVDGKCPECGAARAAPSAPVLARVAGRSPSRSAASSPTHIRRFSRGVLVGILLGTVAIACAICGLRWLFAPHRTTAVVKSRSWSITRTLRTREERHGSGWGSPYQSHNAQCQPRYKGTERCQPYSCNYRRESYSCRPHDCRCRTYSETKDLKNGYSKVTTRQRCDTCYDTCSREVHDTCWHQCPVYRDWCEYDYYEWPVTQTLATSGTVEPVTEPKLEAGDLQRIEQSEIYKVDFLDREGESHELKPSRAEFGTYSIGDAFTVEKTHAGGWCLIEKNNGQLL